MKFKSVVITYTANDGISARKCGLGNFVLGNRVCTSGCAIPMKVSHGYAACVLLLCGEKG